MIPFLLKIWGLARPYRVRLWLGVFMGVLAGLAQATMLAVIKLVYSIVFPTAKTDDKEPKIPKHLPQFIVDRITSGNIGWRRRKLLWFKASTITRPEFFGWWRSSPPSCWCAGWCPT